MNCHRLPSLGAETRQLSRLEQVLGPRPTMTLVIDDMFVREIWVNGRAPLILIRDYDWGSTDPLAVKDADGFAYSPINWNGPAWSLGLSLHPPLKEA
ncbi:MAG: hypothetical protein AAFZ74_16600 [Pseudomonadota bacterium]